MLADDEKLQITLTKTPQNSPKKTKFGLENKLFKTSYLEFVYYNFRFFGRKSQSQQKLVKKFTYFTINFKRRHSFYESQLTQHHKKYAPATWWSQKKRLHCIISRHPRTGFTNCIFQWISVENFWSRNVGSFYLVGWIISRYLGLVECIKTFYF